ncbi:hypothetical protein RHGRI_037794 [Rhododendron griersonianum]|uniref:Uncharacterized protein n=1 Tax=Rhododendron griersonianum TaxID=479676 RepID=A0AAV6HT35_9ERIC|nr:hypothetical protein RHGRI_037794 [Rhododendron griersonianum]KAG5517155.1 hypothetical protein RHGRI_037794 [Rhododendron griersonianum]
MERKTIQVSHIPLCSSHSLPGDKVGGIGPGIVGNWVSKMVRQVLQRALSGHNGLNKEPKHGKHGKSSILELLHLELSKSLRIISKAQRIEASAGVDGVGDLTERPTGDAVALNGPHQDNLAGPDGQNALGMDQAGVAQVV